MNGDQSGSGKRGSLALFLGFELFLTLGWNARFS
jgi:hypothetical protein